MNAGFSYFLLEQLSLDGSDFSSFVGVWKEPPIKSFIFCNDFGSTTIKLFQWHEIGVLKIYTNSCCISSQHFRVITTPVTRTSEIYFLVGCPEKNKLLNVFDNTSLPAFSPLLAYFTFMLWQNAEKLHFNVFIRSRKFQQSLSPTHTCADKGNIYSSAPFHLKIQRPFKQTNL